MSTYNFLTVLGPTGPTGNASTVVGPTGYTGPSVTGPTGSPSTVIGPTGPTGVVTTTDTLVVASVDCSSLNIDSLYVSDTLTVSAIVGPSVLPTYTSSMIGYTTYQLGSSTAVTGGNIAFGLNDNALVLPAGVWLLTAKCLTAATSSNYTITGYYIGITESLGTNVYNNAATGLRFDKHVGSWGVIYNDTRFRPTFSYSQVYQVSSGTKSLYGYFQLNGGSGGSLYVSGSLHATRLA